jgi:hypothetical protein
MRRQEPLTDEAGEVRELLMEDLKRFRPAAEVLSASSLGKLGLEGQQPTGQELEDSPPSGETDRQSLDNQLVGAFGEKAAEAELLRHGWRTANFNTSIKNAAEYDLIARKDGRTVLLRVKTCGPGQNAFQFSSRPDHEMKTSDLREEDYTILVRMGDKRQDDHFYVMPTRILREQVNAHRKAFLATMRRDGAPRKDLGHWTLRLYQVRSGEDRPNYGFAQKWKSYRDAWQLLDSRAAHASERVASDC